ncbi:hypothetical protein [Streptomyces daliensis]|uniref:Uncharacterized protein n=1 Tax=Streptomyces daliensis TaxID=299421 RepID=A0A8T4ITY9_9ACTN|nr:hypothetical protein [Streptomyces daliensis]
MDDASVDGDRSPLVRPYLVAYEREERRTALAPGGADSGPWLLHGPYAGTSAGVA